MIRLAKFALFIVTIAMALGNYHFKDEAERTAKRLAAIDRSIAEENTTLQTLDAEWSYLNDPRRLQMLSARHLQLGQIKAAQVVAMDTLSNRVPLQAAKTDAPVKPKTTPLMPARSAPTQTQDVAALVP